MESPDQKRTGRLKGSDSRRLTFGCRLSCLGILFPRTISRKHHFLSLSCIL